MATLPLPSSTRPVRVNPALAALLDRRSELVAFVRRRVGDGAAEDIVHGAFMRMLEQDLAPRDEAAVLGWFYRVLRNATIDHIRTVARHARIEQVVAHEPAPAPLGGPALPEAGPCSPHSLVASLPATHREALEVVYLRGGSIAELAERTGMTRNGATVRVHRARSALRSLFAASPCAKL